MKSAQAHEEEQLAQWLIPSPVHLARSGGTVRVGEAARQWLRRLGSRGMNHPLAIDSDLLARNQTREASSPDASWLREHVTGGWCNTSTKDSQAYSLELSKNGDDTLLATITSPTAAGVRAGRATLAQVLTLVSANAFTRGLSGSGNIPESEGWPRDHVPLLVIRDAPKFATRGVMIDVSRTRISRMDDFFDTIDTLALLKCNHLQLYTEHTFAYSFAEEVWRGWSPLTSSEIRRLDAQCASRGIELVANQNCFGHLRNWLESPGFASLAETHEDWFFDVWPRSGPFSLCPTDPASIAFVRRMLGEVLPCFTSGMVNIGCDETYDIAFGRSKSACEERGRETVYAEFVARIVEVARELGKRSMFWGDVALNKVECLDAISRDAILLAWGYEPDTDFAAWCRGVREQDTNARSKTQSSGSEELPREVWVCPGTNAWRSITGRTRERVATLDRAAREGVAEGASGYLVCEWGDSGHWQQWPISLRAIADGLACAWMGREASATSAAALCVHALQENDLHVAQRLGTWLDALGDADAPLRANCGWLSRVDLAGYPLRNQTALQADLNQRWNAPTKHAGNVEDWIEARDRIEALKVELEELLVTSSRTHEELMQSVELARFAAERALARRNVGSSQVEFSRKALAWREALKAEHARLWRSRSREGGLAASLAYFDAIDLGEGK